MWEITSVDQSLAVVGMDALGLGQKPVSDAQDVASSWDGGQPSMQSGESYPCLMP